MNYVTAAYNVRDIVEAYNRGGLDDAIDLYISTIYGPSCCSKHRTRHATCDMCFPNMREAMFNE